MKPTCRYGHGELELQNTASEDSRWVIGQLDSRTMRAYSLLDGGPEYQPFSPVVFSLNIYRCSKCGYLELFDDEVTDGGA
jgi:hypothetical protein